MSGKWAGRIERNETIESSNSHMPEAEREAMKPAPLNITKIAGYEEAAPTPPNTSVELLSAPPFVQTEETESIFPTARTPGLDGFPRNLLPAEDRSNQPESSNAATDPAAGEEVLGPAPASTEWHRIQVPSTRNNSMDLLQDAEFQEPRQNASEIAESGLSIMCLDATGPLPETESEVDMDARAQVDRLRNQTDTEKKQLEAQPAARSERLEDYEKDDADLRPFVNAKVDAESTRRELEKKDAKVKNLEQEPGRLQTNHGIRVRVNTDLVQKSNEQKEELQNVEPLNQRIEEMQERINILNEATRYDQAARKTLEEERNDLAKQLEDAIDQMNNDAGNLAELRNRNYEMSDQIKWLKNKISEHEATFAEYVVAERALRQNVATSSERIFELTRDKERLTAEQGEYQKRSESWEAERTRLDDQIITLTAQASGGSDEISRLAKEIEDLRLQRSATNQASENAQRELQKLKKELNDLAVHKEEEKRDCEAEKERLSAEIEALKAQIEELRTELDRTNAEYNEVCLQAEELESNLARETVELDECEQANQGWQNKDRAWAEAVAARDEDLENCERKLKDAVSKIESMQQEVKTVKEESLELMEIMHGLRTRNEELESTNGDLQRRVDTLHQAKAYELSEVNKSLRNKERDLKGQIRNLAKRGSDSSRKGPGNARGNPPKEKGDETKGHIEQRSGSDLAEGLSSALSEDDETLEPPSTTTRVQGTPVTYIIRGLSPPDAPPRRFRRNSLPSELDTSPSFATSPETVASHHTEDSEEFTSQLAYKGPRPVVKSIQLAILRCEVGFQKMRDERAQKGFHHSDAKIALTAAKDIWGAAQLLPEVTSEDKVKKNYFAARGAFMQGVAYYYGDEALRARPLFVEAGTRDPDQYPAKMIDAWLERIVDTQVPPKDAAYYKDPVPAGIHHLEQRKEKKEKSQTKLKTIETPACGGLDKSLTKKKNDDDDGDSDGGGVGGGFMNLSRTSTRTPGGASISKDETKTSKKDRIETEKAAPETQRTYLSLVPRFLTSSSTTTAPMLRKQVAFQESSADELTTSDVEIIKEEQEAWQTLRSSPPRQSRVTPKDQGPSSSAVYPEGGTKIRQEPGVTTKTSGVEVISKSA